MLLKRQKKKKTMRMWNEVDDGVNSWFIEGLYIVQQVVVVHPVLCMYYTITPQPFSKPYKYFVRKTVQSVLCHAQPTKTRNHQSSSPSSLTVSLEILSMVACVRWWAIISLLSFTYSLACTANTHTRTMKQSKAGSSERASVLFALPGFCHPSI